MKYVRVTIQ